MKSVPAMDVILTIDENGVLENAEFDDLAGLDVEPDFEEVMDYAHKTTVVVPDGVTRIGDRAFYDKRWLTDVTLPDSVLSIGNDAFTDCNYLTSVTMSDSVSVIGSRAFAWCESLTSITIMNEGAVIAPDAFYECGKDLLFRAKAGSSAEKHAAENSFRFEAM